MKLINLYKDKILYFLLSLVLITLPFPSYSLNSKAIVLLATYWLLFLPFKIKIKNFKQNKKIFYIFITLYLMLFFSLFISDNYTEGFYLLGKKAPYIILPLIISTINIKKTTINYLLHYFSLSVVITSLFALLKVLYFKFNDLGDYLSYSSFGWFLEKHTTYFALFTIISIIYYLNNVLKKNNITQIVIIIYLFLILYFLSVRISVVSLVVSVLILLVMNYKHKAIFIIVGLMFLGTAFFMSPNFQKRFQSNKTNSKYYDLSYRVEQLNIIVNEVSKKNLFFGFGLGSNRLEIYNSYKDNKLLTAYREKYNSHNQYIEWFAQFGLFGFLSFLLVNFMVFKILIKEKTFLYLSIFSVFLTFMLTESILERQSGLILYLTLIPLFISNKFNKG